MKIGGCIKQEFKQAATLARQPRNAEISTNQARAQPADQSEGSFWADVQLFSLECMNKNGWMGGIFTIYATMEA